MEDHAATLLKQIHQANALQETISASIWRKSSKNTDYVKMLKDRRSNRTLESQREKRALEASRRHLHLNLSIQQKSKRKRISIDNLPPPRKMKRIVKQSVSTTGTSTKQLPARFRHRSLGRISDLKSVSVNPYHSLLTSLVLNKLRQSPHSRRFLRLQVASSLVGMVKEETIEDLVKRVDLWCAVFESLGLVETSRKKSNDVELPSIVSKLARLGDLDTIRRYFGAQVEETVARRIWESCMEWKFPSEVIYRVKHGNLLEILNLCGPQLFHQVHDWYWSSDIESSESSMIRTIQSGDFEEMERVYNEVTECLIRTDNEKIADKVRNKPYAWIWNQSYHWQKSVVDDSTKNDDEDSQRLNENDGEISELNKEQDRLLSNVDSHVKSILKLRQVKQRLHAEEEELIWELWNRMCDTDEGSMSSNLEMGQRLRWHKPAPTINNNTAYPVRSLMLSRMRRYGMNDLDVNHEEKNVASQQTNRSVRMNAVMSIRKIPKKPSTKHTELSNSSETISFEKLLDQFEVVSDAVPKSSTSTTTTNSAVDIPMFRKVSAAEQQRRILEEDTKEEEDTSDAFYMKHHNEYLDRMKEKYRVYNEKLKRREN